MKVDKQLLEEYKAKMAEYNNDYDPESNHSHADDLLCELLRKLGYGEVVDEFEDIKKWYA